GTGDYALGYVWRRDRLSDADVAFPFFWSFRERDLEGGPDARSFGAVAPLVWWRRNTSGEHETFGVPLFWQWGDAQESTTIAANAYWHTEPGHENFGLVPLYFAGRDEKEKAAFDVFWPLLVFRSTEGDQTSLFALNTLYRSNKDAWTLDSFPLVWSWGDRSSSTTAVLPLFYRGTDEN